MDPQSPEKKLSFAEIQRRKINAAGEYFRKLRENGAEDSPVQNQPPLVHQPQEQTLLQPEGPKVQILCLKFSLNPFRFSFMRETDKK